MMVGECWYLDTRKRHRAINGGATERTHLVVDLEANAAVSALLCP
jgi:Aspartyl/Asparaginyl beta-hydroxylase